MKKSHVCVNISPSGEKVNTNMVLVHQQVKMSILGKIVKNCRTLHVRFNFNKKRTKIINADICAVLSLAKKFAIYASLVCKSFGPKVWSCKIFDKFQV